MFNFFRQWWSSEEGLAAVEAGMIFPIMLTLLLGTFDMGNAILVNQKAIRASQVVADLVTRHRTASPAELQEAAEAGRLAIEPMDTAPFGVDIISIAFDEFGNAEERIHQTFFNMEPIGDAATRVAAMSEPNEGVVMVAVNYNFEPTFAGFVVDEIPMQEVAFARGRKSPVVNPGE